MTTPNEDLMTRAKRLRNELDDSNARLDRQCVTAMYEMGQALQSQAERIKELELLVKVKNKPICDYQELIAERDTLRAELATIAATEPVSLATDQTDEFGEVIYREVFTHPMPAQGVEASMINLPEPVELNPAANSVMGHSDATLKQAVRDALDAQGVAELVEALEMALKLNSFREFNDHIPAMRDALSKYKGAK